MMLRVFPVLFILLLVCGFTERAAAHGGEEAFPSAPPAAEWERHPPLEGARAFAETLRLQGRGLLDAGRMATLDKALSHYTYAERIGQGWYRDQATPEDGHYNRQTADNAVLEVTESLQPTLALDFTEGATIPDPEAVLPWNPASQMFLLKIKVSDGPPQFRTQRFEMAQERYVNPYPVRVAPEGTTWVLLEARDVPAGLSKTGIAILRDGESAPFRWHALTLDVRLPGTLRLNLRTQEGDHAPALVRIAAKDTGVLAPIEDARDFHSLLHDVTGPAALMPPGLNILGPDGSLRVSLPGEPESYYWLADSDVQVPLAEGEWQVTVLRGIEHVPVTETVTIRSGEWTEITASPRRWVNMAERGWFSGDDHVHAQLMNGRDADSLMAFAEAMDIRVANILEMGDPQRTYYNQRGFGPEFRIERGGCWLVSGMEDPRSMLGHNIGLNLTSMARDIDRYLQLDLIAGEVREQGGLFGQTHVGQNACFAHRGMALMMPFEVYDFASIMQGGLGTELYYDFLDLGFRLPASAGSDMPYAGTLGDVRVYVHTDSAAEFSPDAWFEGLRAGRTFTTNGPMIEFRVNGALPGETLQVSDDQPLTITARAWGYPGLSSPVSLEIVRLSEVIASETASEESGGELSIETTVEPGDGFWIAARCRGTNGSAAHTTPVYVSRPGRRHWNRQRAKEITERQLAVLDEIETEIARVEQSADETGINPLDFGNLGIYRERTELRGLVERSRAKYHALLGQLEQEVK